MKEPVENRGGEGAAALPSLAHTEGDGGEAAKGCGGLVEVEHSPASMAQGGDRRGEERVRASSRGRRPLRPATHVALPPAREGGRGSSGARARSVDRRTIERMGPRSMSTDQN